MIPLIEWYRSFPDEFLLLEIAMGAMAGQMSNINQQGEPSMMFHALPYILNHDPHSGMSVEHGKTGQGRQLSMGISCLREHVTNR